MTLDEVRRKLKFVVAGVSNCDLTNYARGEIYIISLAWIGLDSAQKHKFETELQADYEATVNQ